MKKTNRLKTACAAIALIAATTSCNTKDVISVDYNFTVGLEQSNLDPDTYVNDESYTELGLTFENNYTAEPYTWWYGFALSNLNDMETHGYTNEFSVYAASGHNSSETFMVGYYSEYSEQPIYCGFEEYIGYKAESLYINNSTLTYLTLKNGLYPATAFTDGDWYKVVITGYDVSGATTGSIDIYLADFRNGSDYICAEWTKVDLTALGTVNKLGFTCESSDVGDYGINTPTYFCIDDISFSGQYRK